MAITLVNHGTYTGTGPLAWTPTIGNTLIVVGCSYSHLSTMTITDSRSNSWTSSALAIISGSSATQLFYAPVTATGSGMTINSSGFFAYFVVAEFSGVSAVVDNSTTNTGTGTSLSTGTLTTTNAVDLVIAAFSSFTQNTWSGLSAGYTLLDTDNGYNYVAYKVNSATQSAAATITNTSGAWAALSVALKAIPDFSLSSTPTTRTIAPGASTTYAVSVTPINGYAGTITPSVSAGLPSGATATWSPTTMAVPSVNNTTLTVNSTGGSGTPPAIAYVQSASTGYAGSGANSCAFPSANTLGNFIVAMGNVGYVTTPTCSDTQGNTWTLLRNVNGGAANTNVCVFYCSSCKAGANTVTLGGGSGGVALTVGEFSGVSTLDVGGSSFVTNNGASTWTSNSITTTHPNELLIGCISDGYGGCTVNSPFNTLGTGENYFLAYYQIVSTAQTVAATGAIASNGSNGWSYSLDGFYAVGTSGSVAPGSYSLTLQGTDGTLTHTTPVTFVVQSPTPTSLTGTGGVNSVALSWTAPTGGGSPTYSVYRSDTGSTGTYNLITSGLTTTTYTDSVSAAGSPWYEVNATVSGSTSGYSNQVNVLPILNPPSGVTGVSGNTSAILNWTAPSTGSLTYNVYRAAATGGGYTLVGAPTTNTYTDTTVANGTAYLYQIDTLSPYQTSGFSTPITVVISPPVLTGTAGSNLAALSWTQPSGATTFTLARSTTGSGGTYSTIYTGALGTYTDSTASSGSIYWYQVTATGGSFTNTVSNQVSVSPSTAPITYVQSASTAYAAGGSSSCAFASANTAGNFLIAMGNIAHIGTATCTDTLGNTWVSLGTYPAGTGNIDLSLFYCINCRVGANTVTLSGGSGVGSSSMTVGEFAGIASLDVGGHGNTTTGAGATTWTSNALTTSSANELLVGCITDGSGSLAVNTPFNTLGTGQSYFLAYYQIVSTIQTAVTATGTQTGQNTWNYSLNSFIGGVGVVPRLLSLTGCGL